MTAAHVVIALVGALVGAALALRWERNRCVPVPDTSDTSITGWDLLLRELERARRYERPLTLVRLPHRAFGPVAPGDARLEAVRGTLRVLDFAWTTDDGLFAMLPETNRPAGQAWVERLVDVAPGLDLAAVRLAEFPVDGLTSGALVDRLADEIELLDVATPDRSQLDRLRTDGTRFAS